MDLEQAIDAQREALLRLLARWLFVVESVSSCRLAGRLPRWMRVFFSSVLRRAEKAADYLAIAYTGVLVTRGVISPHAQRAGAVAPEAEVSVHGLLARMRALKAKLEDLPAHALRLMRRRPARRVIADRDMRGSAQPERGARGVVLDCQRLSPRTLCPPA